MGLHLHPAPAKNFSSQPIFVAGLKRSPSPPVHQNDKTRNSVNNAELRVIKCELKAESGGDVLRPSLLAGKSQVDHLFCLFNRHLHDVCNLLDDQMAGPSHRLLLFG